MRLTSIILAAGKGTRMKSPLPKVLHPVAGRPMIERVITAVKKAGADEIRLVVGHGQNLVKQVVEPLGVQCFIQSEQLGTAHAVIAAQPEGLEGAVLILNGDHPLIQAEDIHSFVKVFKEEKCDLAVITAKLKSPEQMGRIIRQNGNLMAIVEAKDASVETLKINEVNTGIYLIKAAVLNEFLPHIHNYNANKEFYITDLVSICIENRKKVHGILSNERIASGVNSQKELARATRQLYKQKAVRLMDEGVIMIDPKTCYIEDYVEVGVGSVIYPNVFLRGKTKIGSYCVVESNSFLSDATIGDSVQIKAGSYIEKSLLENKVSVGPYARIRPETHLLEESHIGNFVELKKVVFGKRSKAGHLTYLGDAEIGDDVNIGCGTITCNYAVDKKKYRTKIGHRVFVGSDSQFVAPVVIGDDAVIGSGSTITKDVPAKALAVARAKQIVKENYSPKSINDKNDKEEK